MVTGFMVGVLVCLAVCFTAPLWGPLINGRG